MPERTQIERQYLGQFALTAGTLAPQTFNFPLGELWYTLWLRIAATLTVGATPVGGVAYEDPLLELINSIQLQAGQDQMIVDASSKALFAAAWLKMGTAPLMDEASFAANTAAAYAMSVSVPLLFADPRLVRPEDSALASDRYDEMTLRVGVGAGADVLSTAHTSGGGVTLSSMTCDVELEKLQGPIPPEARPMVLQRIKQKGSPIDTATTTLIPLTRSPRAAIKRIYLFASNLGVSARPWSGNGSNAILSTIEVRSDQKAHDQSRRASQVRDDNKIHYGVETLQTGLYALEYTRDGSVFSALSTGDKATLEVSIAEAAAPPAGTRRLACVEETAERLVE